MTRITEASPRVRGRAMLFWMFFAASFWGQPHPAYAQPVRQADGEGGGLMVTVPWRVDMHVQEQRFELITREIGPLPAGFPISALPGRVPVVTVFPDGSRRDGFYVYNRFGQPVDAFLYERPSSIAFYRDGAGGYRVHASSSSARPLPTLLDGQWRYLDEQYPPGYAKRLGYESNVSVYYAPDAPKDQAGAQHGQWDLLFLLPDPLPINFPAVGVNRVVESVRNRFQRVLRDQQNNRGTVRIRVLFEPIAGIAMTDALRRPRQVAEVANGMTFQANADEEPDALTIAENFPNGASVRVAWNAFDTRDVTSIETPRSVEPQLALQQVAEAEEAILRINENTPFDFDATDGINAGSEDFEHVLTHETIHALGFLSLVDDGQFQRTQISLFDVFRFSSRTSVSFIQFQTGTRRLVNNEPDSPRSVSGTVLNNAQHTYRMASGIQGGSPGDHWNEPGNEGSLLGLMIPQTDPGVRAAEPDLIFESDWRALDAIGWNVALPVPDVVPEGNDQEEPPDGQQNSSLTPTFRWTVGARTDTTSLFVFEGPVVSSKNEVIEASGLTGPSYTPAAGVLRPLTTYTWLVTGFNQFGFAPSLPWTFTTGEDCAADFNGDGAVNTQDFLAFLNAYDAGDPSADFTGDGAVTIQDFLAFLSAYDAGC